ncbi:MAG: flagellar biosynthesis protein FliS [Rhodobacteraceae bacterium]|nr:flagellar biosynthesis protein FliS [Paracoccaceae bacterium]|tara:strand:+ start:300 stop:683 length:384 start_codon:yes stop_codon:yes gene_type:complete
MINNKVASLYKKTDTIQAPQTDDPKALLIKIFDELLNSIRVFHKNIVPNPDSFRRKSSSFSKALTILYTLQGSIDFEKDLGVAKSLFQIYEYTRVALIEEFKSCKINKSDKALTALVEIRDSWDRME